MRTPFAVLLLWSLAVGCAAGRADLAEVNRSLQVFGVALGAAAEPPALADVPRTEEPCLRGIERTFLSRALTIGYGHDGAIRKVTTRNPETAVFGIRPGDGADSSRFKALAAGFRATTDPHRYIRDCCALTLLVDDRSRVFGIAIELRD